MKFWNVVTEIRVPFDTEAEAIAAVRNGDDDALLDIYGTSAVISGYIEAVDDEDDK